MISLVAEGLSGVDKDDPIVLAETILPRLLAGDRVTVRYIKRPRKWHNDQEAAISDLKTALELANWMYRNFDQVPMRFSNAPQ
jgi:hypothetical protein